jgi:uncharacterized protein YjiK
MLLVVLCMMWVGLFVTYVLATGGKPVDIDRIGFPEPSGIVYHTGRKTLFVVGDEGDICEINTNGKLVQQRDLAEGGRRDLEGVTLNPATGLLYVAVEGDDRILEVDPETLVILREFQIPRRFKGRTILKPGGQGIEGITFLPDARHPEGGTFLVTNQGFKSSAPEDASALLRVELPLKTKPKGDADAKILRYVPMTVFDLSGLHYDAKKNRLLVISDGGNAIMQITPKGKVLKTERLPGLNQEGIAVDEAGFVYVAQDSGGILKFKP